VTGRKAVFLDRDGTLHRELERAPRTPQEIELLPGVAEALARLSRAGYALVVVSNQSAVARAEATLDDLRKLHDWLGAELAKSGAPIERFYVCPHHPTEGSPPYRRPCACRKPAPGMLLRAVDELELEVGASWMIGDAQRDLQAALDAGARAVLVATGKGARERAALPAALAATVPFVPDLRAAAETILSSGEAR
jgi:D-glycero-D-manno-heptose 1,7-bisphosphate phosphatase